MRSRHNLNYWSFGDYLAIGAGAHGKITTGKGIWRYVKPGHPRQYMEAMESREYSCPVNAVEGDDLLFEFMLNAARLTRGFSEATFSERTGLGANTLRERLAAVAAKGLVVENGAGNWQPTALGAQFLNNLQAEFLPE
jgi:oxygen-independent coproporphyrinogen-3 oxidase